MNDRKRTQLLAVQRIREYASNQLALPDNKSYTQYVELNRDNVTWVVFAAPELSLQAKTWCFLIVGCVPYRGYFQEEKADKFAQQLIDQGLDVYIAPVTAYSTLGWFSDPVLSTMLNKGLTTTAEYIFHELAHQEVYIKNDSDFNEAFATAVAQAGVQHWLRNENRTERLATYEASIIKKNILYAKIKEHRNTLENIYSSQDIPEEKRNKKIKI